MRKGSATPVGTLHSNPGVCRTETMQVMLDCSQGSGLVLGPKLPRGYAITQILPNSVADQCGCVQIGDRLLAINKLYNLDANTIRQILGDNGANSNSHYTLPNPYWVELEIEFDMSDSVIPSQGVFNVKLAQFGNGGLGITVNGTSHGTFVISEVKRGSPAHRTGSLRAGDILLAVDSQQLQHYNVDALLKDRSKDFTMLTINRNSLPDFLFDAQQRCNAIYSNGSNSSKNDYIYGSSNMPKYLEPKNVMSASTLAHPIKAQSCQPEYFTSPSDLDSRQSTPAVATIRRPFLAKQNESACVARTMDNTHSLTTEITEEDLNAMPSFDIDYRQR